ncbi:hypothetical protein GQ651_13505 [Alphaproteobacteria bacterium GH1-50]|uniref:Leishmanolysin n=1 Tax=Kangsaoukella pontilimi TaxID=2691042 RepID=A0A7C9IHQ3_9RHOB|nr:hypothetical protein [Kangsaoukella pontilimi]MXQ08869.1 hypothetical protein [Kangsaoukella pontilimi]
MRGTPILPDIFGDEFEFVETLFSGEAPPDRDGGAADGPALADALGLPDAAEDAPVLPVEADPAGPEGGMPSVTPWGEDAQAATASITVDWVEVSPFNTHAGNHGGGGGSDGGDTGGSGKPPKDGGGGGGKGGGDILYYSDNGVEAGTEGSDGLLGFDIVLRFTGDGWTELLLDAFKDAADYLTTIIQDDWDLDGTSEITARREKLVWDDLLIDVSLTTIDGSGGVNGNVLAQAGPAGFWPADIGLPAQGFIEFDTYDFVTSTEYAGLEDEIAFHEMMHVLGFGTLWGDPNLLNPYGKSLLDGSGDYNGTWGTDAYAAEFGGTGSVPVEGSGGAGTAGGHWDEQNLGTFVDEGIDPNDPSDDITMYGSDELMTGYISGSNFLSYTSVMSLQDLGYDVAYVDYDPSVYTYDGVDIDTIA